MKKVEKHTEYENYTEYRINEAERKPNRYTANALFWAFMTLFAASVLNFIGIFEVEDWLIWSCLIVAALFCAIAQSIAYSEKWVVNPKSKYVMMATAIILTLIVMITLNNNATLFLMFPIFIATRYRSIKIANMAIAGSAFCCVVAPVLSWVFGTWSLNYFTGFVETVCDVKIVDVADGTIPVSQAITNILMYISLPQLMVIAVFSSVVMSITQTAKRTIEDHIRIEELSDNLNSELEHVKAMQDQILLAMGDIVENRDMDTGGHVKRTSDIVLMLVEKIRNDPETELSEEFCDMIVKAAPLHDLGKIAVDDAILRKPGRLNDEEMAEIRKHPVKSAEIIHNVLDGVEEEDFIKVAENLALYHHEWYNGKGYPEHLEGEAIPLEARIMAIADVYDALVSKRSYKEAFDKNVAFKIIEDSMGTQFDPKLNKYFIASREEIEKFYAET